MKQPVGLLIASVVLVALAGLVWWTNKHPTTSASTTPAAPKILSIAENQVQQIRISKPGSNPVVLKKLADKWAISAASPVRR